MNQFIMGLYCIGIGIIALGINPGHPTGYLIAALGIGGGTLACIFDLIALKKEAKKRCMT